MLPFAAAGFRVESFDMAGQYESAPAGPERLDPPQQHYTLDLFVDDLVAVLRSRRTPRTYFSTRSPERWFQQAAVWHPSSSLAHLLSAPPLSGQRCAASGGSERSAMWCPAGRWGGRSSRRCRNVHAHRRIGLCPSPARFALAASGVADIMALMKRTPDLAPALRATGIPTLVVVGEGDVFLTAAHRASAERLGSTSSCCRRGTACARRRRISSRPRCRRSSATDPPGSPASTPSPAPSARHPAERTTYRHHSPVHSARSRDLARRAGAARSAKAECSLLCPAPASSASAQPQPARPAHLAEVHPDDVERPRGLGGRSRSRWSKGRADTPTVKRRSKSTPMSGSSTRLMSEIVVRVRIVEVHLAAHVLHMPPPRAWRSWSRTAASARGRCVRPTGSRPDTGCGRRTRRKRTLRP